MNLKRIIIIAAITIGVLIPVKMFVVETIYIASESMEPTLPKGTYLFLDKITYRFRMPGRGEIISFHSPVGESHDSVKRVIGTGGDTVGLVDKKVFINGEKQFEPYTQYLRAGEKLKGDNLEPVKVPEGFLFVLGDNRDLSNDSSSWVNPSTGERILFIPLSAVDGKVRGSFSSN